MALKKVKQERNFGRMFFIAIALFVVFVMVSLYYYQPSILTPASSTTTSTQASMPPTSESGTVLIAVKDISQKVGAIGTLNSLFITFTKAEVHFVDQSDSANASGEWKTVFEGTKTVDLLTLGDVSGILGQEDLPSGKYTQLRLTMENVVFNITNTLLTIKNKNYDAFVTNSSDVPSGELRFVHPFNVTAGKTTAIIVDFDVQQSVKRTADGYMLRPVVKITDQLLEKNQFPENSTTI